MSWHLPEHISGKCNDYTITFFFISIPICPICLHSTFRWCVNHEVILAFYFNKLRWCKTNEHRNLEAIEYDRVFVKWRIYMGVFIVWKLTITLIGTPNNAPIPGVTGNAFSQHNPICGSWHGVTLVLYLRCI